MDLLEIEIKAYCDNPDDVINKVIAKGGEFISTEDHCDTYFNHPKRDFKETDEAFRIRRINDKTYITYKGPKLGGASKTRLEEEVEVGDFEKIKKIIMHLGFIEVSSVVKQRGLYIFNGINVCIDLVEGLGSFVELEKMDAHKDKVEKELFDLANDLGLNRFETRSYLELKLTM